ncbi:DciA family protein [Streptomyces sp. NPDC017248]|uniref:DciA family protein n=1 Tax=unclassified Streptomyces TaxID=2593676 RepID=UPI0037947F81
MRTEGRATGVDLARQALVAARETAKKSGATQTKKAMRRTGTVVRRDGREPLGLGATIGMMMTERGMAAPAAGGSVLAQFDDILAAAASELAGHVQTVKFDADTGRLDVAPDAPAYGTQLHWSAPKLIAAANEKVSGTNVRTLHVLPPAPGTAGPAVPVPCLADRLPPREQGAPTGAVVPGPRSSARR